MTSRRSIARAAAAFCLFCASVTLFGCKYGAYFLQADQDSPDERISHITQLSGDSLPVLSGESCYSFVIFTDTHFGASHTRSDNLFFDWFSEQLAASDTTKIPRFAVNLGDTLNAGNKSEVDDFNAFCDKIRSLALASLGVSDFKVYSILGNHDLYNDGWSVWKKHIWPYTSYYSFSVQSDSAGAGGFSFYFLDSANGTLGYNQLHDVTARLEADANRKVVFIHYPVYQNGNIIYYTLQDSIERNLLISAFEKNNVVSVFEGHRHKEYNFRFDSFTELVVPSLLYHPAVCLVTIDEAAQTVSQEIIAF